MTATLKNIAITTIVRVSSKKGFEKQTLDWFYSIAEKASHFNGHLSSEILTTCNNDLQRDYVSIFHFDSYENLLAWENSEERNKAIEVGKVFFHEIKPKLQLTGLEYWFENKSTNAAPVKWKMLVITVATIFILLNTIIPLIQPVFDSIGLASFLKKILSVLILVSIMTYLIMPFLSKLLSGWIFSQK